MFKFFEQNDLLLLSVLHIFCIQKNRTTRMGDLFANTKAFKNVLISKQPRAAKKRKDTVILRL